MAFEPTTPAFERAKTVHDFDRAAIVIGDFKIWGDYKLYQLFKVNRIKMK
jgi:hypothetical protein